MASISFVSKGIDFHLDNASKIKKWLLFVGKSEKVEIQNINFYFVSSKEILSINKNFLKHNYQTDVITFADKFLSRIDSEIFICIDVVMENATNYSNGSFSSELYRVIVHGMLHCIGYKDDNNTNRDIMRKKEDLYLKILFDKYFYGSGKAL